MDCFRKNVEETSNMPKDTERDMIWWKYLITKAYENYL